MGQDLNTELRLGPLAVESLNSMAQCRQERGKLRPTGQGRAEQMEMGHVE